ncbi:hypothetical protein [Raineyella sp. LH-20]|uniref:hypothetical protein n=1 Tax=Raineyella sp. LH-20 TaxID=3081204 RepID=UPI002952A8B7|nr:hypothetical protein [Raineyella sp. LH-20]WOP17459.1 hypothetical protein R0146_09230 [Raineyella sp. LH-20]
MLQLEVNGGAASGSTEIIVFGVLALAIVAIGLLLFRSLRKIDVPYAADLRQGGGQPGAPESTGSGEASGDSGEESGPHGADRPDGAEEADRPHGAEHAVAPEETDRPDTPEERPQQG